jgi:hypothetical protein
MKFLYKREEDNQTFFKNVICNNFLQLNNVVCTYFICRLQLKNSCKQHLLVAEIGCKQ